MLVFVKCWHFGTNVGIYFSGDSYVASAPVKGNLAGRRGRGNGGRSAALLAPRLPDAAAGLIRAVRWAPQLCTRSAKKQDRGPYRGGGASLFADLLALSLHSRKAPAP